MCGFLVYKDGTKANNFFIQKRGQDLTNKLSRNSFNFVHNLLSITGDVTPQPFEDDGIICLFNGEIYNHKYVKSDGENLIPLYKKYGVEFPKYLDGEWALALYDFKNEIAVFSTDLFATKPIWRKGLECASYESGLGGVKIPANTIEVIKFDGTENKLTVYDWDLNQHKQSYDDWIKAFERAITKRATKNCFIGLSSGYDSGIIACELLKQGVDFKAFIIENREDKKILEERIKLLPNYTYLQRGTTFLDEVDWLKNNVEDFRYKLPKKGVKNDSASLGLSKICRLAHNEGRKVYLSGQGGDEIYSDYSPFHYQSTFKGKFPEKIDINLWENFYNGCQYSYLGKEECVAGSHSIETRYPLLDKDVVQEFLWLSVELKNKNYKAPIHEYFKRNNFPFKEGAKIGLGHLRS